MIKLKFLWTCSDRHRWKASVPRNTIPRCPECGCPAILGVGGKGRPVRNAWRTIRRTTRPAKRQLR